MVRWGLFLDEPATLRITVQRRALGIHGRY